MRAPHTYFSTEVHGGTRALRARLSNLFAAPRRRGRLPLLGLVLLVGALGGLVACHGGSSATIAMDTQYYDDRGSILEIPQITGAKRPRPSTPLCWRGKRSIRPMWTIPTGTQAGAR